MSEGKSPVHVRLAARTEVGRVREHNEDNFLIADLSKKIRGDEAFQGEAQIVGSGSLFAVCDGMGGAAAGEVASQLAVDTIYKMMAESEDANSVERDVLARRLVKAIETAGLSIYTQANADRSRRGMGTTVTAATLLDHRLFLAQVGDSRGYILRGDKLTQVTRDQSLVNQLIEAGQLTEEEAENFEHNNIILQALGTADSVQVDLTHADLKKGDVLLLCSDGLSGMVRNDEIREILMRDEEPAVLCKALTDRANEQGGHDNITVIVGRFDGDGLPAPEEGEAPLKYAKYALPEEDEGEPTRAARSGNSLRAPSSPAPADSSSEIVAIPSSEGPLNNSSLDDPIELPETALPSWAVIVIVALVIVVLTGLFYVLGK